MHPLAHPNTATAPHLQGRQRADALWHAVRAHAQQIEGGEGGEAAESRAEQLHCCFIAVCERLVVSEAVSDGQVAQLGGRAQVGKEGGVLRTDAVQAELGEVRCLQETGWGGERW